MKIRYSNKSSLLFPNSEKDAEAIFTGNTYKEDFIILLKTL
jgi:hypothetical protein